MACIANQGKAIGDNPPDNLHDKNTACYSACQDQSFPFMRPVLMLVAMLVFDVVIVYAVDVFDSFSPVKLGCQKQQLVAAGFTPAPGAPMNGAVTRFEISEH